MVAGPVLPSERMGERPGAPTGSNSAMEPDRLDPASAPSAAAAGDPGAAREALEERFSLGGRGLREHTTRGVLINSAFQVGFALLSLLQRVAVAAFLTASEFGFWGVLLTIIMTLVWLKQVGISEKYIQQDEADQEAAFQKAFTLELCYTMGFYVFMVTAIPVFAAIYDRPDIIVPALILSLVLPIGVFSTPVWVSYRQMRFVRQRVIEAINPIVTAVVTIGLAVGGAGYWSLVWGALAGAVAGSVVAVATSQYKLRLRYEPGTMREYLSFSWPLLASGAAGLIVVQGTLIVGNYTVGLAGLGAIALAASFTIFADRVDAVIMRTLYPAICAVKDQTDVLFEAFTKSNRLALIWGLPFGVSLLLFAPDLVDALGERWRPAEPLLQALGLMVGIRQIGFNWAGFMTATGNTRPLAINGLVIVIVFLVATMPLMFAYGLDGYLIGVAISLTAELAVRAYFLSRLFTGFNLAAHALRAFLPSVPAVAAVLAVRSASFDRSLTAVLTEVGIYIVVTALATLVFERRLLSEIAGYARGERGLFSPAGSQRSPLPE